MKNNIYIVIILIIVALGGFFLFSRQQATPQKGEFSASVQQANSTKSQEVVNLKNGDTYNLTASIVKKIINGQEMKMLAYNGSIPGPLIKVPQGAQITLKFTNNTDVDSTIHSHGVRVDNKFDGVPDITQDPVKPGNHLPICLSSGRRYVLVPSSHPRRLCSELVYMEISSLPPTLLIIGPKWIGKKPSFWTIF
jgi:hypothetical protein